MHSGLISIITPCYNAAPFLKEAIDSVLSQTYQHFEWILVNDGSIDETEAIIQSYTDTRICYYKQKNQGQCAASNYGLTKATGDYIKFFDADDIMNADHLEAQIKILNGRTDALASCAWGRFYNNDPFSAQFIPEPVWQSMPSLEWIKASLSQKYDMMGAWLWLIPRTIINSTGGWDRRLSLNNDFEFSMRLLTNVSHVKFAENAKLYYRSGMSSLSSMTSKKLYKDAILSTELGCKYLLEKENSEVTRRMCANRFQEWLFRIYPNDKFLENYIEKRIIDLGGSDREIDGGKLFRNMTKVIGWKAAKRLKNLL